MTEQHRAFWIGLALGLLLLYFFPVYARDPDGRYAGSPLKPWFDGLRSEKGPCCSDADGQVVIDADWESKDGHYRVRLEGAWYNVPDDALLTVPNRDGRTIVWPIVFWDGDKKTFAIRCFIPGAGT